MATARRRKRPKRYHHGNLREVLTAVALEVLEREGHERLTLRRVTDLAGVSQTAIYNHFSDRKNLLVHLATEGFNQLRIHLEKAISSIDHDRLEEYLRTLGHSYLDFANRRSNLFGLMFGREIAPLAAHPELFNASLGPLGMLVRTIEKLVEYKKPNLPSPIGPATISISGWGLCHGITVLLLHSGIEIGDDTDAESSEELLDQAMSIFFSAIRP